VQNHTQSPQNISRFIHQPLRFFAAQSPLDQPRAGELGPRKAGSMMSIVRNLWQEDQGQDIAEYAVMLAVILVIVVGTIRLVGGNANNVFSSVGSSVQ
jgi:Flp pilus assembly pilin Flp